MDESSSDAHESRLTGALGKCKSNIDGMHSTVMLLQDDTTTKVLSEKGSRLADPLQDDPRDA